ncbi:hypothetical protein [Streptomyces physcomitrii]|uniref:Uncharacterized protein n=1 Tax=Streptomyces physcomitrii TaxID=2724184 RepID=A0ABX1H266_9ACTN|nr:hypothetical protein [Streptomyces physcomitrii]NKI42461.1 hypothetical protein [Streptomyces physcomitrii]
MTPPATRPGQGAPASPGHLVLSGHPVLSAHPVLSGHPDPAGRPAPPHRLDAADRRPASTPPSRSPAALPVEGP